MKSFCKKIDKCLQPLLQGAHFIDIIFISLLFLELIFSGNSYIRILEIGIGFFYILEFILRIFYNKSKGKPIITLMSFVDFIIIFSIFQRFFVDDHMLLHIVSSLRILRFYRVIDEIAETSESVEKNKDVYLSAGNLLVFLFIMSSIIYANQVDINENINSFVDALYFTTSTLTTTGYGDIAIVGVQGKIIVIFIMILGVGLFVKLVTSLFKPSKSYYRCSRCGLYKHDRDASHCKHCGKVIHIETDGDVSS